MENMLRARGTHAAGKSKMSKMALGRLEAVAVARLSLRSSSDFDILISWWATGQIFF